MKPLRTKLFTFVSANIVFIAAAIAAKSNLTIFTALFFLAVSSVVIFTGLSCKRFDEASKIQKGVLVFLIALIIVFSYLVCLVSAESELTAEYPLEGYVDDYGCYPQMFDAFKKGQLNIDTESDLYYLSKLDNPYDYGERREKTGNRYQCLWDRAYYNGKIYSYFGIAPVIFIYFPFYFLTGRIPSDALAAAILCAIAAVLTVLLLYELTRRLKNKPSFAFFIYAAAVMPFASLVWQILTCANFYHIAVISGICAVCAVFLFTLYAQRSQNGFLRRLFFAFAGGSVAAVVASRPNHIIYMAAIVPVLIGVILKKRREPKSLAGDITAFSIPMLALGSLIGLYNYARFGSPFDFGSAYQLTVTDTGAYSFCLSLVPAALYHYFIQFPNFSDKFPYLSPSYSRPEILYSGISRFVYISKTVGIALFPATWGTFFAPLALKKSTSVKKQVFFTALTTVFAVAVIDMMYGGVHLRYGADILFMAALIGIYCLIASSANAATEFGKSAVRNAALIFFAATVLVSVALTLDNERDMILKFHPDFYKNLM